MESINSKTVCIQISKNQPSFARSMKHSCQGHHCHYIQSPGYHQHHSQGHHLCRSHQGINDISHQRYQAHYSHQEHHGITINKDIKKIGPFI